MRAETVVRSDGRFLGESLAGLAAVLAGVVAPRPGLVAALEVLPRRAPRSSARPCSSR